MRSSCASCSGFTRDRLRLVAAVLGGSVTWLVGETDDPVEDDTAIVETLILGGRPDGVDASCGAFIVDDLVHPSKEIDAGTAVELDIGGRQAGSRAPS
jgi:hypothetical protein